MGELSWPLLGRLQAPQDPMDSAAATTHNEATSTATSSPLSSPIRADEAHIETRPRLAYLDTLKVGLIAGIIAAHAFVGYTDFGSWPYQDVREVSLSSATDTILTPFISLFALFLMGLFFLMAGLLTPGSLERKGVKRFVQDRLLRLGVPFAAFTLLLWPLMMYAIREPFRHEGSYWWWFTHAEPFLDNGPLWFVGILLLYSLGYAAWRAWRRAAPNPHEHLDPADPPGRALVGLGIGIAAFSFLVRLQFPIDTPQTVNLHLWEWPQCLGLFALGVVAARRSWLMPVSDRLRRRCGAVALVAALAIPALIFTAEPLGQDEDAYMGGFGWPSLATSMAEGALCVAACVWVLAVAQRHAERAVGPWLARSAYGAFMLQGPILVALAMALREIPLPGDVKAVTVAVLGVAASFLVAHPLVTRTRLGRIL
jgi:hypothetical protein